MDDLRALSYGLGQQYFDERKYRDAVRELLPVVEATPEDVGTRLLLARAYFHAALLKPAEEHLLEVLKREPTEAYAHLMLARTLERQSPACQGELRPAARSKSASAGRESG